MVGPMPGTDSPATPAPYAVVAQNLPEHARNPIHTDAGAQAAGFPRALVAGVTTYAYLTHPIVAAWGLDWLAGGTAVVRFRSPVFLDDELICRPETAGGECTISALVGGHARVVVAAAIEVAKRQTCDPASRCAHGTSAWRASSATS